MLKHAHTHTHTGTLCVSVLSAKHAIHTIGYNTIQLTYKSLITSSSVLWIIPRSSMLCNKHLYFPRTKYSGFYLFFNKTQQQIRFITESELRQLWKPQHREPFVLPAGTGCTMNLVISHAFKPGKLITDIYGPQLTGFIRFTHEHESCGRGTRAPCWACVIHVLYSLVGVGVLSCFFF